MKKNIMFLLITLLCITGCSFNKSASTGETIVKKCTSQQAGVDPDYEYNAEYNIYSTDNFVDKVEITETVTTKSDEAFNYFEAYSKKKYDDKNNAYGGITYKIDKSDDKIVVKTTVDYSKMNTKSYSEALPDMSKYLDGKKILLDGVLKYYGLNGITCEEED